MVALAELKRIKPIRLGATTWTAELSPQRHQPSVTSPASIGQYRLAATVLLR